MAIASAGIVVEVTFVDRHVVANTSPEVTWPFRNIHLRCLFPYMDFASAVEMSWARVSDSFADQENEN